MLSQQSCDYQASNAHAPRKVRARMGRNSTLESAASVLAMSILCVVCSTPLPNAAKRRVLHPSNSEASRFFVRVVSPGHRFFAPVNYVCRKPCFSNLLKAVNHKKALDELLCTLRASLAKGSTEAEVVSLIIAVALLPVAYFMQYLLV